VGRRRDGDGGERRDARDVRLRAAVSISENQWSAGPEPTSEVVTMIVSVYCGSRSEAISDASGGDEGVKGSSPLVSSPEKPMDTGL